MEGVSPMQINTVRNGLYPDPTMPGRQSEPIEATSQRPATSLTSLSASPSAASSPLREILAQYDVTDITPREFSEMLHKMHKSGVVAEDELKDLSLIRGDLDRDGIDPDESINLVDYYANKLRKQPPEFDASALSGDEPSPEVLKRRLDWLEKLALVQSSPDDAELDEVA
jgi:hypothetical protein